MMRNSVFTASLCAGLICCFHVTTVQAASCIVVGLTADARLVSTSGDTFDPPLHKLDPHQDCERISVASGRVRVYFGQDESADEMEVDEDHSLLPPQYRRDSSRMSDYIGPMLKTVMAMLEGDEQRQMGVSHGASADPVLKALPSGKIVAGHDVDVELPLPPEDSLKKFTLTSNASVVYAAPVLQQSLRIPAQNLHEGKMYEWTATLDGSSIHGQFTVMSPADLNELLVNLNKQADLAKDDKLLRSLIVASGLIQKDYYLEGQKILRGAIQDAK